MPGRTGRKRVARSAAGVRRGSMTTTLAPARTRSSMRGARCELETVGLAPHRTMRSLWATSIGSALAMPPKTSRHAFPAVAAQMVCSTSAASSASNSNGVRPSLSRIGADEL